MVKAVTSNPEYSIVIPVYNSALILPQLIDALFEELPLILPSFEIILVDDHSKDNSWELIQKAWQQHKPLLKAIKLKKNYGQYKAIEEGIKKSIGTWAITMDDDMQIHPKEIAMLLRAQEQTDTELVYGYCSYCSANSLQRLASQFPQWLVQGKFFSQGRITSFSLSHKTLAQSALNSISKAEHLSLKIHQLASKVHYVSINKLAQRAIGVSSYSFIKRYLLLVDILPMSPFFYYIIIINLLSWSGTIMIATIIKISFFSILSLSLLSILNFLGSYPWLLFLFRKQQNTIVEIDCSLQ